MLVPNPSIFAAALLAALLAAPVQAETVAWYDAAYRQCAERSTQGIVECIAAQTESWDERLNAAYGVLMKQQSGEQRTALRHVQRLWIRYRDGNCGFYAAAEGTISRIAAAECLRVMTAARALELDRTYAKVAMRVSQRRERRINSSA